MIYAMHAMNLVTNFQFSSEYHFQTIIKQRSANDNLKETTLTTAHNQINKWAVMPKKVVLILSGGKSGWITQA